MTWLFPDYSLWQSLEVVQGMNTFYLVQMRTNSSTGAKQFRTIPIIETYYSPKECVKIEVINQGEETPVVSLKTARK